MAIANARDSGDHKDIIALIKGAPTVFSEVLVHYEKAGAHLLRVGACVRIARWLTEVWCGIYHPLPDSHPFAKYQNESEQVADGTESSTSSKASLLEDAERERVCIQLPKTASNSAIFIAKADAAFWTMRIWDSGLEHLSLQEQVHSRWLNLVHISFHGQTFHQIHMASAMATNFGAIGYHRKYAFFLRQTALLMLPFVTRGLDSTSAEVSNVIDPTVRLYDLGIHAGDSEMAIMCLVIASIGYGVVSGSVASSTAINQFLLGIVPPKPLATDKNRNRGRYGATAFGGVLGDGHRLGSGFGYGWFDLQIDVLKEGVAFAERLKGIPLNVVAVPCLHS